MSINFQEKKLAGTESGVDTVLVLSGVTNLEKMRTYAYQPTVILDGVGDIVNKNIKL